MTNEREQSKWWADDERVERYRDAIRAAQGCCSEGCPECHLGARAAMAASDAERVELSAEVERIRGAIREYADSRGVQAGDEDDQWYSGYRQAQRESLWDAQAFANLTLAGRLKDLADSEESLGHTFTAESIHAKMVELRTENGRLRGRVEQLQSLACADCETGEPHACATSQWAEVAAERDRWKARALEEAGKEGAARARAEAVEVKVARVEALVAEWAAGRAPTAAAELRRALDGDA